MADSGPDGWAEQIDQLVSRMGRVSRSGSASALSSLIAIERELQSLVEKAIREPALTDACNGMAWSEFADAVCQAYGVMLSLYSDHMRFVSGNTAVLSDIEPHLMTTAACRVQWERIACRPGYPGLWRPVSQVLVRAKAHQSSRAASAALLVLANATAGFEQIPAADVTELKRLIDFLLPELSVGPLDAGGGVFHLSPLAGSGPVRTVSGHTAPGADALCFITWRAHVLLDRLMRREHDEDPLFRRSVVEHLGRQWSLAPPVRRFRRHLLEAALVATTGFGATRQVVHGEAVGHEPAPMIHWRLANASRGGVGVVVPGSEQQGVAVGDVVAFRADGSVNWQVGIVRRKRFEDAGVCVGIETLSQKAQCSEADDGEHADQVVICDPIMKGEAVRLVLPRGTLDGSRTLFVSMDGRLQKLRPLDASLEGKDYVLRVYQVV